MTTFGVGTVYGMIQDALNASREHLGRTQKSTSLHEQLQALISAQGEVSGIMLAQSILARYQTLEHPEKQAFFTLLAKEFGLDAAAVTQAAQHYADAPTAAHYQALMHASEPPRQELLRRLNAAPGGTLALVKMREDLGQLLQDTPELKPVDLDFQHLFASWFNRGFLRIERIDWQSAASLLERIIHYEAVHSISDWDDLRQRVSAPDRACYAFFHPALGSEPLIFVEVALTAAVPASIHTLLAKARPILSPTEAKIAVFYSISNCQKGLRGVSFGAFLIKQVLRELQQNYPNLKTWVTLSPVPTFTNWLGTQLPHLSEELATLYKTRETLPLISIEERRQILGAVQEPLRTLALTYFTEAKHTSGAPLDPVARFHLENGASILNIHTGADLSDKGVLEAFGLMANYQYEPDKMLANHEAYASE